MQKSKIKNQNYKGKIYKFFNSQLTTYNLQPNKGQIVLILVLITVVGLTVGLSLISRTVTDVRISSQIEQSGRAFSAAEAGVESALKGTIESETSGTVSLPGVSADYNIQLQGGSRDVYSFPLTEVGANHTVWLIDHKTDSSGSLDEESLTSYPANSSIDVCWGSEVSTQPAIIVSLYYKVADEYKVARAAYDSNHTRGNDFYPAETSGNYCGSNYRFRKTITPTSLPGVTGDGFGIDPAAKLLLMRIQPVYESTNIAIDPAATLPVQGKLITSVGKTETGIVRKIQVYQGYQVLPTLLDFGLFSEE